MDKETAIITQSIRFRRDGVYLNIIAPAMTRSLFSSSSRPSSGYRLVAASAASFLPLFALHRTEVERLFRHFENNHLLAVHDFQTAIQTQNSMESKGWLMNLYQTGSGTEFLLLRVTPSSYVRGRALCVARARPSLLPLPKPRSVAALEDLHFDTKFTLRNNDAVKRLDEKIEQLRTISKDLDFNLKQGRKGTETPTVGPLLTTEVSPKGTGKVVSIFGKNPLEST